MPGYHEPLELYWRDKNHPSNKYSLIYDVGRECCITHKWNLPWVFKLIEIWWLSRPWHVNHIIFKPFIGPFVPGLATTAFIMFPLHFSFNLSLICTYHDFHTTKTSIKPSISHVTHLYIVTYINTQFYNPCGLWVASVKHLWLSEVRLSPLQTTSVLRQKD